MIGCAPIHVNKINVDENIQKLICLKIYSCIPLNFLLIENGREIKIKIDINSADTPPNLLGIDRKIAYANRKYHSGLIWLGVTIGFAGTKLSGSISINGLLSEKKINIVITIEYPNKSLIVKYGWNGILSVDDFNPMGLFDPEI